MEIGKVFQLRTQEQTQRKESILEVPSVELEVVSVKINPRQKPM